jgi:hypothetical protein
LKQGRGDREKTGGRWHPLHAHATPIPLIPFNIIETKIKKTNEPNST